jgi:hypothetical protein
MLGSDATLTTSWYKVPFSIRRIMFNPVVAHEERYSVCASVELQKYSNAMEIM